MKTIRLHNKRQHIRKHGFFVAFVSDEDYDEVQKHKWFASVRYSTTRRRAYACTYINKELVYLHHFITGINGGLSKPHDHIDGNGLNNTRENLRMTTPSGNQFNSNRSGIDLNGRKWRARIIVDGQYKHLGQFRTEEEAKIAYEKAKAQALANVFGKVSNVGT